MLLGVALTQHCNLRCPHCIRDDVATVRAIEPSLVLSLADDARALFGDIAMSFTGGEPTLHADWNAIVAGLTDRKVQAHAQDAGPVAMRSFGWDGVARQIAELVERA